MNTGYVLASWLVVFVVLGAYAAVTIARGRRLARRVPAPRRRWIDSTQESP